ncbi:MAG: ABC transporter permease [Bacteriovorax sp.]|nr:ABC transporter permease [Bacteriovorax sp.]
MKINQTLLGFIRKEFIQTLRDPKMRALLFVAPIIQMTLFGVAISSDVKNVRLSYIPHTNDTVLEHVYQRAIKSGWFIPARVSTRDPFGQIHANEADAVLVAPPEGLTDSIARGRGQVQLLINASNVLRAQSIENYMNSIFSNVIQKDLNRKRNIAPIHFDIRILYNPTIRTAVYMVPGVMSTLICLITITLTSMSISKEKETGTFEMLVSAPTKKWEIILGKTLPYIVLGVSNVPLILGVAVFVFDVPMRGSFLVLILSSIIFVCTTVSIGTLISILTKTQQQSMMASFLFLFPAIQLSGMTFPIENMPPYMKFIAYLNPLTYFLELLRNIMLKGGDTRLILSHFAVLILMGAVLITISFKKFKNTLG